MKTKKQETGTTKNRNKYKSENKQMTSPSSNSAAADGDAAGGGEAVSSRWQSYIAGSRRTLRILTFTSVAYFTLWSPYVALVVVQSITGTFEPPSAVEFAAIWPPPRNRRREVRVSRSSSRDLTAKVLVLVSRPCSVA